MKIGIVTAMSQEFTAVGKSFGTFAESRLGPFRVGCFCSAGHEFTLVESGAGFQNASSASELLVRDVRPDLLLSTGYCGGITEESQVGDLVVAKAVVIVSGHGFTEVPVTFSPIGLNFVALQAAVGNRVAGGTFISTPAIMPKKRLAGMLARQYPNPVVEMESGSIAIVAAESGIPFLAIRTVSDSASEELQFSLEEFCGPDMMRIRLLNVFRTVLRKPYIIPQLLRLSRSSRKAAEGLTTLIPRLFPVS